MDRPNVPHALTRSRLGVVLVALWLTCLPHEAGAIGQPRYVEFTPDSGSFPLVAAPRCW
jgi:hypothetical protein